MSRAKFALGVPLAMVADTVLFALLRRARPRPFGLSRPAVYPAMLRSAEQSQLRSFRAVVLSYGHQMTAAGQLIEVETCFADSDFLPALDQVIARAELRDQAWARSDWMAEPSVFGPAPDVHVPTGFEQDERIVVVAGRERRVAVTVHHRCEALRFVHESTVVTAVSRLGFPDGTQFDLVTDLEPYLTEHRRFILSWLRFWEA